MAVGLTAIRDALSAQIDTQTSGLRCYARVPGQVQTPAVVVLPSEPYVDRDQSMQRGHVRVRFDVAVLVRMSDLDRAQDQLDDMVDTVVDAILSDRTLSANVLDLHVPTVSAPDDGEVAGVQVLACRIEVSAIVADS